MKNIFTSSAELKKALFRARRQKVKIAGLELPKLTKEQEGMIKDVWGKVKIDTRWISHFNRFREEGEPWSPYYVPDPIQYAIFDLYYSNYRRCRVVEDKNLNSMLFSELIQPETVLRRISQNGHGSVFLDAGYKLVTREEALRLVSGKRVIVKPSINSGGGHGVLLFDESAMAEEILRAVEKSGDMIVQKVAQQHSAISALNPSSLNSIRFVSFIDAEGVHLLSSILRVGGEGAHVDNASSGGVFCGVHNDGTLRRVAHNLRGECFISHPSSGIVFDGYRIPGYQQCCDAVIKLAPRFYGFSRLISWDLAIATDGSPMLIEANMTYGGADIPQIANGPMFGDLTSSVIKEVFSNKKNVLLSRLL